MRSSSLFMGTLFGLLLAGGGSFSLAADAPASVPPAKPVLLLRMKPLEELIADMRFLGSELGREQEGKQLEELLKAQTGPNGLEGVDARKPFGLFATVKPSLTQSEIVLLLPVADEKSFLAFLEKINFKPEKEADGVYNLQVENVPVPLMFRFSQGYLYGMAKLNEKMVLPPKDKIPDIAKLLGSGSGILSLTMNVDQLPPQVRKLAVSSSALLLGELKEKELPNATAKQKAVWDAILDEASRLAKSFLEDATRLELQFDMDRKARDVSLALSLEGKPDSPLARNIAGLAPAASVSAGLESRSAVMGGRVNLALPDAVRKAAGPAIEEAIATSMASVDPNVREILQPLVDTLKPTLAAASLDLGLELRGPGKNGLYTLVSGMAVRQGSDIEKAVKKMIQAAPAPEADAIKIDVAKENGVNIHQITPGEMDAETKKIFGTGPGYFAVRDNALFFALGEDALATVKESLRSRATTGQPVQMNMSVTRLVPFMKGEEKSAPKAAKKAFTQPDSDQMRLGVRAGERLEIKMNMRTAVIAFGSYLDQFRKEE